MAVTKVDITRQGQFSGDTSIQSHKLTNVTDPTSAQDAATKAYVDAVASGLATKASVQATTTGSESFTISSGSVTIITGTVVDGVSPAVNDRILIKDAPSSTGSGSAFSDLPGNGIYKVTSNTTNLSVSRATDFSGSNGPAGAYVFSEAGTANVGAGFTVIDPTTNTGFVYGTNNIKWTQFSGAGEITVGNVLTKSANNIQVSSMATGTAIIGNAGTPTITAISGDITVGATGVTAIGANKVTLGQLATLAANSAIANSTGSTATPTAVPMVTAATASAISIRDANANVKFNNTINNLTTAATAASTTTLTVSSSETQQFTGSTTQTVVLPDATTLSVGHSFTITNRSSGVVTVNANGGGLIQTMAAGSQVTVTAVTIGTSAGTWDSAYSVTGGGTVTTVSVVSTNGFSGTVANATTAPAITMQTTITGVLKGNGTAISAATAGSDYMAPSDFIIRETPSGTINGANTTFTLANTPLVGTEEVFLNGILQEPAAGNDYTISGATITYLTAPLTGDRLRVSYQK